MTLNRTLTAEQVLRHFIGFSPAAQNGSAFPPHNIEKVSESHYILTLAVAGFSHEEIDVSVFRGTLTIKGVKKDEARAAFTEMVYQGIAFRDWERHFNLGEHIQVTGCKLQDGLLTVSLEEKIPEEAKPKKIAIF